MQRLNKNVGKYLGDGIDLPSIMAEIDAAAKRHGWRREVFLKTATYELVGLTRSNPAKGPRIYISSGIHGDEPAGPLATLKLIAENHWPADASLWLCPCLNPTGFPNNCRENIQGIDLNRQYLKPLAEEIRGHIGWLERQPNFDVTLCLHEDWEAHGFYVYELNPDQRPSLAPIIVQRVSAVCPIDMSLLIEGREANNGIIRPGIDPRSRTDWPEAFYLISHKSRLSYTMEAPSDFPLPTRVAALVASVRAVVDAMSA